MEQMQLFIAGVHNTMSAEAKTLFPHFGVDEDTQGMYLARSEDITSDLYITWHLKPMALRMAINLTERDQLVKAFKAIEKRHEVWIKGVESLQGAWELRYSRMEYNPETKEATRYDDVYNDHTINLSPVKSAELVERMQYLNGEEKWLGIVELIQKFQSDFVSAMGVKVTDQFATMIDDMMPILNLLAGGATSSTKKGKSRTTAKKKTKSTSAKEMKEEVEEFMYNAQLKPLHIRKGFINMTSLHWPFFAQNSRTTIREVTLLFDGNVDKDTTVWRLVPDDRARIKLSDKAHMWLEDNFTATDTVQIHATKRNQDIEIELALVQSE